VACLALPYFSTLSHDRYVFGEKRLLNIKCVLIFYIIIVYNISHSKKESREITSKENLSVHVKYPLFLSHCNETAIFSTDIPKIKFNNFPTRYDLFSLLHFCRQLYMFRLLTPIIRSWYSCNYRFWH